jgi:hypothetical protein
MPKGDAGKYLKALRKKLGKFQKDAYRGVYCRGQYSRVENSGHKPPREKLLEILIRNLKVSDTVEINRFLDLYGLRLLMMEDCKTYNLPAAAFTPPSSGETYTSPMTDETTFKNPTGNAPVPQEVKWRAKWAEDIQGSSGMIIDKDPNQFIPWDVVRMEIHEHVLPNLRMVPIGSSVVLGEYHGRLDWVIRILDPHGVEIGNVWIGGDPLNDYTFDGLVRAGIPEEDKTRMPTVWQVFQRYSNGTYIRVGNPYDKSLHKSNEFRESHRKDLD